MGNEIMKKIIIVITVLLYSFLGSTVIYATDTLPDMFTLNTQTSVELNTVVTSNSITVSGIDAAAPISITGGTYSINGGSYTSDSGTVNNGDIVTVQLTSSGSYSTRTMATLTIGGLDSAFFVVTRSIVALERYWAVGFSIGSKGYIGTGDNGEGGDFQVCYKDFWEYEPETDSWTQKADVGGVGRRGAPFLHWQ
jgi:hypothetical protein